MVVGDVVRAVLYLSIPLNLLLGFANQLTWLYVAQFLACCASLFWTPVKDASIPNLVPPDKLRKPTSTACLRRTARRSPPPCHPHAPRRRPD